MAFELKLYQSQSLETLQRYLDEARLYGAKSAFQRVRGDEAPQGFEAAYREIPELAAIPYICLRLPTGAGKTLLAAYSIPVAGATYLDQEFPAVLWFVPSRQIKEQTISAMKDERHPYRVALEDAFNGRVRVFDSSEITQVRPKDLVESSCVVVSTLSNMRVEDTEGRHFYAHNEAFEPFFQNVPASTAGLERDDHGRIKYSFANLLHLKHPIVIVDEAHNARTSLTFDALARVNPACIIEFTATPDRDLRTGSNVLYSVSARELRDADMIKLPIVLTEHHTWEDAVHAAIAERESLAKIARDSNDSVRPVVLFQAQSKDKEVTVARLEAHLVENERIARERIAVATGDQRELVDVDLFDPACRIDFIITVAALREGWDCSFAYVLCSLAEIRSSTAVEQLLGRVLRMPYATRRREAALNKAYAHIVSKSFIEAAQALQDKLVDKMGFDRDDFFDIIEPGEPELFDRKEFEEGRLPQPFIIEISQAPSFTSMELSEGAIKIDATDGGTCLVTVAGPLTEEIKNTILSAVHTRERLSVERSFQMHDQRFQRSKTPSERGDRLGLPRLAVPVQGELELAEPQLFLDYAQWNLLDYPVDIPNFHYDSDTQTWVYDFYVTADGKETLSYKLADNQGEDLMLPGTNIGWTEADLIRWLDRKVHDASVPQLVLSEWLRRLVNDLVKRRGYPLETLVRAKFILASAIVRYIVLCKKRSIAKGYQAMLFGTTAAPEATFQYEFEFDPNGYDPKDVYSGTYVFTSHYYPVVGNLKSQGEEFRCAQVIDSLREVAFWVRNLDQRSGNSFWLPTSTDRFYPDFICKLNDGRALVVEYKGKIYETNDDSAEKRSVGELWANNSGGTCLFLLAVKDAAGRDVEAQIRELIRQ